MLQLLQDISASVSLLALAGPRSNPVYIYRKSYDTICDQTASTISQERVLSLSLSFSPLSPTKTHAS